MSAKDQRSSLLQKVVDYNIESFITLYPFRVTLNMKRAEVTNIRFDNETIQSFLFAFSLTRY
jgi:hypothetical protein